MFWKSGYLSPWVRQQWSEEEQIAATLFTKRTEMRDLVDSAIAGGEAQRQQASEYLSKVVSSDPVLLLRIEATRLLGDLSTETSASALQLAAKDRAVEVRMASVRSHQRHGSDFSGKTLSRMARGDADSDVRIAAAAALGTFSGQLVTETLGGLISDPNPAMQIRAAESLSAITGQDFGNDMLAWQAYVERTMGIPATSESRVAEETQDDDSMTRFR